MDSATITSMSVNPLWRWRRVSPVSIVLLTRDTSVAAEEDSNRYAIHNHLDSLLSSTFGAAPTRYKVLRR
jgi:hypothetical protein